MDGFGFGGIIFGGGFWMLRERASRRYRSTSPVRRTNRVFDCGERWVRVDDRVCGLMYVSCYSTAREDGMWSLIVGGDCCLMIGGFGFWDSGNALE